MSHILKEQKSCNAVGTVVNHPINELKKQQKKSQLQHIDMDTRWCEMTNAIICEHIQ